MARHHHRRLGAVALGLASAVATASAGTVWAATLPSTSVFPTTTLPSTSVTTTTAPIVARLGSALTPTSSSTPRSNTTTPSWAAPAGTASGAAVSITPIDTCISCTNASAGPASAAGTAQAVRLFGHDLAGGSGAGNQSDSGALIAVPTNPLLSLAVADWMEATQAGEHSSSSTSRAALVDLSLAGGQVATVAVLEASSNATWSGSPMASSSQGNSSSNGVVANLGNGALVVILLHSDASSADGTSDVYLASVNGDEILSAKQVGQPISISIPRVATITLLPVSASGGAANAAVGTVSDLGGTSGQQLGAFQVGVAGGPGASANGAGPARGGLKVSSSRGTGIGASVPNTGTALGIAGFIILVGGLSALALGLRRRRQPVAALIG